MLLLWWSCYGAGCSSREELILWAWGKPWLCLHCLICKAERNRSSLCVEDSEDLQIKAPKTTGDD